MNQDLLYSLPIVLVAKSKGVFYPTDGKSNANLSINSTTIYIKGAGVDLSAPIKDITVSNHSWRSSEYSIKYNDTVYTVYPHAKDIKGMFFHKNLAKELKHNGAKYRPDYFTWVVVTLGLILFIILYTRM